MSSRGFAQEEMVSTPNRLVKRLIAYDAQGRTMNDYVHCIERNHVDHKHESWCGKHIFGVNFVSLDHAAENGLNKGRLVACRECVEAATKALKTGWESNETD